MRWYVKSVNEAPGILRYRSVPLTFHNTKHRCMAYITCSIRDLEKRRLHLNRLDESVSVLQQLHLTATCLLVFYERLHAFGVDRYQQNECGSADTALHQSDSSASEGAHRRICSGRENSVLIHPGALGLAWRGSKLMPRRRR